MRCSWRRAARSRARGASPGRSRAIGLAAGVVGIGAGALAVTAIFYERVWAPPPTIRLVLPRGADPAWIIVLEDAARGRPLDWRGIEAPFMGRSADLAVPAGGIVRVASLDPVFGEALNPVWPDGATALGAEYGDAPPGTGARRYMAWTRRAWHGPGDDLPRDAAALEALIRARE